MKLFCQPIGELPDFYLFENEHEDNLAFDTSGKRPGDSTIDKSSVFVNDAFERKSIWAISFKIPNVANWYDFIFNFRLKGLTEQNHNRYTGDGPYNTILDLSASHPFSPIRYNDDDDADPLKTKAAAVEKAAATGVLRRPSLF